MQISEQLLTDRLWLLPTILIIPFIYPDITSAAVIANFGRAQIQLCANEDRRLVKYDCFIAVY